MVRAGARSRQMGHRYVRQQEHTGQGSARSTVHVHVYVCMHGEINTRPSTTHSNSQSHSHTTLPRVRSTPASLRMHRSIVVQLCLHYCCVATTLCSRHAVLTPWNLGMEWE